MAIQQLLSMDWIKENIKDPIPMSDKKRIHEHLDTLTHDDHTIPEKCGAINAIGIMSIRYGAFFVIMCGVIPVIKKYLISDVKQLSLASAITLKFIAKTGGCNDILQEGMDEILESIIIDTNKDIDLRDACATAYGWIMSNPPEEINNNIIG